MSEAKKSSKKSSSKNGDGNTVAEEFAIFWPEQDLSDTAEVIREQVMLQIMTTGMTLKRPTHKFTTTGRFLRV